MEDKQKLKTAMNTHKSVKKNHKVLYNNLRDELTRVLVKSNTPDWGGLKFTITRRGV